jgi:hypothetical protein
MIERERERETWWDLRKEEREWCVQIVINRGCICRIDNNTIVIERRLVTRRYVDRLIHGWQREGVSNVAYCLYNTKDRTDYRCTS